MALRKHAVAGDVNDGDRVATTYAMELRWMTTADADAVAAATPRLPPHRQGIPAIKNDIAGWTPQRRDRKVAQLASVIVPMNAGSAPDLLGVCEVENRFVLDRLVDAVKDLLPTRSYSVVHADTDDTGLFIRRCSPALADTASVFLAMTERHSMPTLAGRSPWAARTRSSASALPSTAIALLSCTSSDLVASAKPVCRAPLAVVCLISALTLHELTDEIPAHVQIAVLS